MNRKKAGRKPLEHAKKTTRVKVMNEWFLKQIDNAVDYPVTVEISDESITIKRV